MKALILTLVLALLCAAPLAAGDFEDDVKDLGESGKQASAIERLSKAGLDAFDDVFDGLKLDPDEEGIEATEKASRSDTRLACARLLGIYGDTRASETLRALLLPETEPEAYPWLRSASASALGRIWGPKKTSDERKQVVAALKKLAADEAAGLVIRWGCLRGLARLKQGAALALGLLGPATEVNLRLAAIEVLVAAGHKAAGDKLFEIAGWRFRGESSKEFREEWLAVRIEKLGLDDEAATRLSELGLTAWEATVKENGAHDEALLAAGTDKGKKAEAVKEHTRKLKELWKIADDEIGADDALKAKLGRWKMETNPLRRKPPNQRTEPIGVAAVFALASLKDKRCVPGLVDILTLSDFDRSYVTYRKQAEYFLRELQPEAIPMLADLIRDHRKSAEWGQAALALGEFGADGVAALLAIAYEDKEGETILRDRVDLQLNLLRNEAALEAFVVTYRRLDPKNETEKKLRDKVVNQLLAYFREVHEKVVFKEIADDIDNIKAPDRARAINAYADGMGKEAFEALKVWVKDKESVVRRRAVQKLGTSLIPLDDSTPVLKEAVADEDPDVRRAALRGLQRSDDKELLPVFVDALDPAKEPDALVRARAIDALEQFNRSASLEDEGVYGPIKARLKDTDPTVRAAALRVALDMAIRIGETKAGAEMLEAGFADAVQSVRSQAYGLVFKQQIRDEIDPVKLVTAALKETAAAAKGDAVQALSQLEAEKFDEIDKIDDLVQLALGVLDTRNRRILAKDLLAKLASRGVPFGTISAAVRKRIDDAWALPTKNDRVYESMAFFVDVLVKIEDDGYFKRIKVMIEEPKLKLRRACVKYYAEFGVREDLELLRRLRDNGDSAAVAVRRDIENAIRKLEERE